MTCCSKMSQAVHSTSNQSRCTSKSPPQHAPHQRAQPITFRVKGGRQLADSYASLSAKGCAMDTVVVGTWTVVEKSE